MLAFPFYHKQLSNTKTSDNKSTLLHFLVQTVESKCPEVLNIKDEIPSVPTAAKGRELCGFLLFKVHDCSIDIEKLKRAQD